MSALQNLIESKEMFWLDESFEETIFLSDLVIDSPEWNEIKAKIEATMVKWNVAYRAGNPIVDDQVYDSTVKIMESVFGTEMVDTHTDVPENDERKQKLPIRAASMNKCKTVAELKRWAELKGFDFNSTEFTISAKFDGITLVVEETGKRGMTLGPIKAWTKGRDGMGLYVPQHFQLMNTGTTISNVKGKTIYTRGEAIIKKKTFQEKKYIRQETGKPYENARNLVSGKFTDKEPDTEIVKDIDYIRFFMESEDTPYMDKHDQFCCMNMYNVTPVPYVLVEGRNITEEYMYKLFKEFGEVYDIDGLIVEVNSAMLRRELGYETSTNNPCFARAFKGDFEEIAETEVVEVRRQISKQGYLKPVLGIKAVRLDGATVTSIFVDNERWIAAYGIGIGSKIKVKRSGMVIPRVVEVEGVKVLPPAEFNKLWNKHKNTNNSLCQEMFGIRTDNYMLPPEFLDGQAKWNENKIEIVMNEVTDDIQIQRNIAFFEILEADGISDGIITELYNKGYKTIKEILNLSADEMKQWDGWGEVRASNVWLSMHTALNKAELASLAHASGFFKGLGSTKLKWVFNKYYDTKPTHDQLMQIDGYSDKSAVSFLEGYDQFHSFIGEAGITIPAKPIMKTDYSHVVVFTGFRDSELEKYIQGRGYKTVSSYTKEVTILVAKDILSSSSKIEKARKNGARIIELGDFKSEVGYN
jgi:DNA ligase (NAD+)